MTTNSKQIAIEHFNRISAGDIAGAAALMSEDSINHAGLPTAQGRAGFTMVMNKIREGIPDYRVNLEDVLADGDRVMLRMTVTGTHTGPLPAPALAAVPPTGKSVKFEQIHVVRVADGKIVEHWMGQDSLALFRQLGLKVVPN